MMAPQGEYHISQDNDLFNSIRTGNSAIEPVLEDWMEIYQRSSKQDDEHGKAEAIAQLIDFFLRCCGCNSSLDKDTVLDLDAVTDNLDKIQEEFKLVPSQTYPLITKSGKSVSKNFKKNLIDLVNQLVELAHSNSVLYDQHFLNSVQCYLVTMSSSTLRSFRHTSTVIILFGFINPICQALVSSRKELIGLTRKVQSESAKSSSSNRRVQLAEWKSRQKQVSDQTSSLETFINEFFDGVFVHRYRDADPSIRADCVQALGKWMTIVPDYFLEGTYLRYIGWVLTDNNKDARNEALKALNTLYSKDENFEAMQYFTTRFKSSLLEMAIEESDLSTRLVSINIVTQIDRHGLLDSHERNQLGRLIYHQDQKVRKAVSGFFNNLFEEALDARKIRLDALKDRSSASLKGNKANEKLRRNQFEKQIAFKCLAHLLLKLEKESKPNKIPREAGENESNISDDELTGRNSSDEENEDHLIGRNSNRIDSSFLMNHNEDFLENGRIDFAIEDLWNQVKILHDWQSLCDYLLLDHTASTDRPQPGNPVKSTTNLTRNSATGENENDDEADDEAPSPKHDHPTSVDEACKLSESEETMLVEVLVASLRKFGSTPTTAESMKMKKKKKSKRKEGEEVEDEEAGMITEDEGNRPVDDPNEDELENKIELTRVMITLLPKLWSKFFTDPLKLTEVFRIPKLMSLNMYLDLRMVSAFEEMWDTMIKQYLKQQHRGTIQVISSTIAHVFRETKSLQHINQNKILKLHQALISSFQDLTNPKSDELESVLLEEVEIISLTLLLTKISNLFRQVDLSSIFKIHPQNPAQSSTDNNSPYNLINAIARRGRLAHPTEAKLVEVALEILQLNFTWTGASVCRSAMKRPLNEISANPVERPSADEDQPNPPADLTEDINNACKIRDHLINLCIEYVQASDDTVDESVKRAAFIHLLNTYLLCQGALMPDDLRTECGEQTQSRCASFVQAQISNFILNTQTDTDQGEDHADDDDDRSDVASDSTEVQRNYRPGKGKKSKTEKKNPVLPFKSKTPSVEALRRVEELHLVVTTFAKSIRCGLIHFQHSVVIIEHFTRFSKIYDISVELIIATLNDIISNCPDQIGLVAKCLTDSFKAAFNLYLKDDNAYTEDQFIRICRLLQSVFIIRGPRMTFKPRLDVTSCADFHVDCLGWLIGKATDPDIQEPLIDRLGSLFRGLGLFSLGLDGRSCLRIKGELERLISEREFLVPTSKAWDPYQHYLKRLITVMAKDPSIKRAAKLALQQLGVGDEVGEGSNEQLAATEINGKRKAPRKSQPRGRPRKSLKRKADEAHSENDQASEMDAINGSRKVARKSQRGRPRKSLKQKASEVHDEDDQSSEMVRPERPVTQPRPKRMATRKPPEAARRSPDSPPGSSRVASSVPSYSQSPAVSVRIPIGSKRKIGESLRSNSDQAGKRARVGAVVIEKLKDLRSDRPRRTSSKGGKSTPMGSNPTPTASSIYEDQGAQEEQVDEPEQEEDEDEELTPKKIDQTCASNNRLVDHDLNQLAPRSDSPVESEASLAQIKRKSRLKK